MTELQNIINKLFDTGASKEEVLKHKKEITEVIALIDSGMLRTAEKKNSDWHVNEWVKKAILLYFKISDNRLISDAPDGSCWYDKIAPKFNNWKAEDFSNGKLRTVPLSYVRFGSFIAPSVVLMPSFVNIGAYVGEGTMVDTWSTIGSCAQIGKNCHISGGVGIGGVLEPLQASPVIIEDNCFIGARSEVAEGVIVEEGSVISMGVYLGKSTKIIDRATGEVFYGRVPAGSVVVSGTTPSSMNNDKNPVNLYCAVIVKKVDQTTRSKTSINELLRDV